MRLIDADGLKRWVLKKALGIKSPSKHWPEVTAHAPEQIKQKRSEEKKCI